MVGPHAEPDRPVVRRWSLGLGAAARRCRQVPPEGRPRPRRGRRAGVPARPDVVAVGTVAIFVIIPFWPRRCRPRPRPRHLLCAGHLVASDPRRPDGRVVFRQQVLADGWCAGRRPAHRLRAAAGAGRGRGRDPGRHDVDAGHRRGAGPAPCSPSAASTSVCRSCSAARSRLLHLHHRRRWPS